MNLKHRFLGTIFSGLLAFTPQMFAAPSASPFNGLYAGFSLGHSTLSAKKENVCNAPPSSLSGGNDFSSNNAIGTLGLGYGIPIKDLYTIAFEPYIFFDSQRAKSTTNYSRPLANAQINEIFQRKSGVGLKASFGYLINPQTLLYGGIVVENSSFSAKVDTQVLGVQSGATQKKNLWGMGPTIGIKLALTNKSSFELNYTYTLYEQYKRSFPLSPPDTFTSKVTPRFSIFRVGYSYKF